MTETQDTSQGPSTRTHTVETCPRCGTNHGDQRFEELVRPIRLGGSRFSHWWRCKTTGEPVLAEFPPDEEATA